MTLLLLLAAATTLGLLSGAREVELPPWASPRVVQLGLLALVGLFAAYALEKEVALGHLTRRLLEEQVLTTALTSRLEEANAVLEAGRALQRGLELDEILGSILAAAVELLDGRDGSIMLVHGDRELRTVITSGRSAARGARISFGEGIAGRVADTREPLLVTGTFAWRHYRPGSGAAPTSAVSVPLVHQESLHGVLNVNAREGRSYTEHDLRALTTFADQAAAVVSAARLIETQRAIASRSAFQAQHDALTGLPNRSSLLERIEVALQDPASRQNGCALLFLDLDGFRRVNDSLGHAAGDRLLAETARRLRDAVRAADTVARVGADEFAVLLVSSDPNETASTAHRLQRAVAAPFRIESRELEFTASVGIAYGRDVAGGADDLLRSATTALDAAKALGKGRAEVFEPAMRADAMRRLDLEQALRHALELRQLVLHYQPIALLANRATVALEALLRWRHPSGELLEAGAFLPFAEHAGLVPAIDRWVLDEACRQLSARLRPDSPPLRLSVNLSPVSLLDRSLVDQLAETLATRAVEPGRLVLEVTETALLTDTEPVAARLRELRALGVRVALDDFGTGYSSLSWLRAFPVDQVKVDRQFVDALDHDPGAAAVVEAIVRLGRGLAFEVVAEGVGSDLQLERLGALGCELGQGYHLARPMPWLEAELLLEGGGRLATGTEG